MLLPSIAAIRRPRKRLIHSAGGANGHISMVLETIGAIGMPASVHESRHRRQEACYDFAATFIAPLSWPG
jgi:hypothetical protein